MGTGGSKVHESFTIAPTAAPSATAANSNTDGAGAGMVPADAGVETTLPGGQDQTPPDEFADSPPAGPGPADLVAANVAAALQLQELAAAAPPAAEPDAGPPGGTNEPVGIDADPDAVLTPIPDEVPTGDPVGTPVLCGGGDLVDSTATVVAYDSPAGPRHVLLAVVDEDAEGKLLEALSLSQDNLVPVQVETEVHGRLPVDKDQALYEQLEKVAKSVNHHLKANDGIPPHTHDNHAKLVADLEQLAATGTPDEAAMATKYLDAAHLIGTRLQPDYDTGYHDGGKVPYIGPHEITSTATVTKWVPAPSDDPNDTRLPATVRDATRIDPTVKAGTASWDGHARTDGKGKEYVVDLGDGYEAVYRPYAANDPASSDYSLRGALDVTGPAGTATPAELVNRLGQLNLVNQPMTAAEGEWTYLKRNISAQGLAKNTGVAAALKEADGLEDAVADILVAQRASQAIGMNEQELHGFARQIRLDAEARALPHKVHAVRDAVAAATGHASGHDLAASASYNPVPQRSGGWFAWERFDVAADTEGVRAAFGGRGLRHSVTGSNVVEMLRTGVLASTERRHTMGIGAGKGMSESADKASGGATSVFLRVSPPKSGPSFYWDDPTTLLRRADWYAYDGDHFGALNPSSGHSLHGQTRDPTKVAGFQAGNNEVMFRNGIDLLGAEAPSRIACGSTQQRDQVLQFLSGKGITHLAGRPITKVVTT